MTSEITTRTTRNKLKQLQQQQQQQQQQSPQPQPKVSAKKEKEPELDEDAVSTKPKGKRGANPPPPPPTPPPQVKTKTKTPTQTRSPKIKETIRETFRETIKTPEKLEKPIEDSPKAKQAKLSIDRKQDESPTKTTTTPQKETPTTASNLVAIPITPESKKDDEITTSKPIGEANSHTEEVEAEAAMVVVEKVGIIKPNETQAETEKVATTTTDTSLQLQLPTTLVSDATKETTSTNATNSLPDGLTPFTHESDLHDEAVSSIIKTAGAGSATEGVSRKRSKSIGALKGGKGSNKKPRSLSKSLKLKSELTNGENDEEDDDDDEDDEDDFDSDDDDFDDMEEDDEEDEENNLAHRSLPAKISDGELNDENDHKDILNASEAKLNGKLANGESEKLRRRLPMSIKELIDYHSSNGKSIKEIVNKINVVCRADEKVSYGYVQKYLYRKKLEATTAKKARYYRKKYGFVYRRMRRKPVLTENHRSARIQWCATHHDDKFDQDIFIGKTALKPFLASLNQLKGQPVDPTQPRTQTTLHLWGAISRKGASPLQIFDGALTTAMYLEILLENVVPFIAENFPEGHRFHQDNNPKHSAKLSQEFLESTGINWVKSPPRSHDLNPIELVWTDLIQVVAKRLPKTIGQVVVAVKEYWKTLTPEKCSEFIDKLVDDDLKFIQKVVPKVMEKNGEWVSIA